MGLHDIIYMELKTSITFREHEVDGKNLKWECMKQYISDCRLL